MRHWPTLLLAVILAGLGAYLYWVDLPAERAKARQEDRAAQLLGFGSDEITAISMQSPTVDVRLSRDADGRWHLTEPIQAQADQGEVRGLLRALTLGRVERVLDEQAANLAPFGLDKPSAVLTITAGPQRERLVLGDSGPITATLYAMRDSDQKVLLTDLAPKDFYNKTLRAFRQKEILAFDPNQVERIRLTYPPTEFVLYRARRENADAWQLRYPIETPADSIAIKTLLFKMKALEAIGFVDPGPEHERLTKTLGEPSATITLYIQGRDHGVSLFQPDPGSGQAFARSPGDGPLYRINPFTITDLTKDLFALRDKRLLGIEAEDLAILEVRTRSQHYVLVNQSGTWRLEDQPGASLNREVVDLFLSRVAGLPAEIQVLKRAGALAPYGLASPTADFRATSKRGKTTRLILGKKGAGLVYAKGGGLPGIYQARADLLNQIPERGDLLAGGEPGEGGPG